MDYSKFEVVNRKASHEYFFEQTMEVGVQLLGTEVKSIKNGEVNLSDAYCLFKGSELFIISMYIAEYKGGNNFNHETRRERKLLLKKSEIKKWKRRVDEKGNTIVPFRVYISDRGLIKLEIALAKGKKSYDKRESLKAKDDKRNMDRIKKFQNF